MDAGATRTINEGFSAVGIGARNTRRSNMMVNKGMAKNKPTARPKTINFCSAGICRTGAATGMSSNPTTGMIHEGVTLTVSWRLLSQRLATTQANRTIPVAPNAQRMRAPNKLTGAITIGRTRQLTKNVPNRFPAIGWSNSALTDCGASTHFQA